MVLKLLCKNLTISAVVAAASIPSVSASFPTDDLFGDFFKKADSKPFRMGKSRFASHETHYYNEEHSFFIQKGNRTIQGFGTVGNDGLVRGTINGQPFEGTRDEFYRIKDTGVLPAPKPKAPAAAAPKNPVPPQQQPKQNNPVPPQAAKATPSASPAQGTQDDQQQDGSANSNGSNRSRFGRRGF